VPRLLAAIMLLATMPRFASADLRVAIRNDVFTDVTPPADDDGFTHDFDIHFWRPYREYLVGARLVDRWVTERVVYGGIRRDLFDLLATAERTFGDVLTPSLRIGPTFTGNLGGKVIQNAFHTTCHCGRKLSEGLQDTYVGDNDIGLVTAARVYAATTVQPWLAPYAFVDGRLSLGTGVSSFESTGGAQFRYWRMAAHVELAFMRFHLVDERFEMAGSYRSGWQFGWRAGLQYEKGRVRIGYEYRANEDGSGEPIGVVAVTIKQAGTSF
jgi:hypothetical protein